MLLFVYVLCERERDVSHTRMLVQKERFVYLFIYLLSRVAVYHNQMDDSCAYKWGHL